VGVSPKDAPAVAELQIYTMNATGTREQGLVIHGPADLFPRLVAVFPVDGETLSLLSADGTYVASYTRAANP
jgi:hypothetical protein